MQTENLSFPLSKPLLVMKAPSGFLACGYINPATCDATGEACAIVRGVNNYDDMLVAQIVAVSQAAAALGVEVGQSGESALKAFGA